VGSCQRRKGNVLLQQGSIHRKIEDYVGFVAVLKKSLETILSVPFELTKTLAEDELRFIEKLQKEKYETVRWNQKY
jgi:lipoate-protein ligase A